MELGEIQQRLKKGEALKREDWGQTEGARASWPDSGRSQRQSPLAAEASASIFRELGASCKACHR